jgi:hypothetical protein
MQIYSRRVIDSELDELMPGAAAISLDGPKAAGKTATASQRARTVFRLDDEAIVELLRAAPERILHADAAVMIDEWQRMPAIWDVVRRAVDNGAAPCRYPHRKCGACDAASALRCGPHHLAVDATARFRRTLSRADHRRPRADEGRRSRDFRNEHVETHRLR